MTRPDPRRWACLLLAVAGCQATKPPLPAPDVRLQTDRALGSPLNKPRQGAAFDADSAVGVRMTWLLLPTSFDTGLIPLDAASSLTAAPLGEGAILPSGGVSRDARFGRGVAAMRWLEQVPAGTQQVGQQRAFVSPGTTIRFGADTGERQLASIAIYRDPSNPKSAATTSTMPSTVPTTVPERSINASFAITFVAPASVPGMAAESAETVFLSDQPLSVDTPFVLLLPKRNGDASGAIAAFIETLPSDADDSERDAWLEQTRQTTPTTGPALLAGSQLSVQRALQALAVEKDPRSALIYLSSATDARITADVALVADATLLGKMRDAVKASNTESAGTIGWVLEKTTLLTLADAASKAPLPPEMVAVLAVHAGEVGRHPDLLTEIANAVGNRAGLQERLVGENFIALEDNSASARVRAFDWLKTNGKAPADFDPLGPPRARRAAINRAVSTPGGTP